MGASLKIAVVTAALIATATHAEPNLPPLKYVSENGICQFYTAAPTPAKVKGNVIAAVYTTCNVGGSRANIVRNPDGSSENLDRDNWSYMDWFEVRCAARESRAIGSAKFTRQFWGGDATKVKPSSIASAFTAIPEPENDLWFGGAVAQACQRQAKNLPSM